LHLKTTTECDVSIENVFHHFRNAGIERFIKLYETLTKMFNELYTKENLNNTNKGFANRLNYKINSIFYRSCQT